MEFELQGLPGLLFLLLIGATLVQLVYYLLIYRKLAFFRETAAPNAASVPVSVIIAARNEAGNLENNLPLILQQDYPDFEVILANDRSYDGTADLLKELQNRYSRLRVVNIPEGDKYRHGKKFALTMAIKAAGYDTLLFTDADCKPRSAAWISSMMGGYGADTEIVLGSSPYERGSGLLNAFIRYETFYTAASYLSFALAGIPYMGVGRNLSYKKALFFKHKGFARHLHLKSGDDDLFVNQAANRKNTRIVFSTEGQTLSKAERTWGDFFRQKRRHQSVGKYYKGRHKFLLSLLPVSVILFYICFFSLAFTSGGLVPAGAALCLKWLAQYIIFYRIMKKMDAGDCWPFLPFMDLIYHIYILVMKLAPAAPENVQWR